MKTKKSRWLLALACALYAGESVLIAVSVYVNSLILRNAELGDMKAVVSTLLIALGLAVLTYIVVACAVMARLGYISDCELSVKREIMKNILRRPISSFRGKNDAYYLNLLSTDVELYRTDYLNVIPFLFCSVAAIASSVYMLFNMHPWLLIAAVVMAALPMLAIKPFSGLEQRCKNEYSDKSEGYTNILKETVEGYETIRSASKEGQAQNRYMEAGQTRQKAWAKYNFVSTMSFETLMSVAGLSNLVCLGVGSYLVVQGAMAVSTLFAAANYFTSISNNFTNITDYIVTLRSTKEVMAKLKAQSCEPCPEDSGLELNAPPDVVYENVSFAFGERALYSDFSRSFASGGCYAIVGESGSGKSTLIRLLTKYYDDYKGRILLGGRDIRLLSEAEVFAAVGVVNQSPYLFNAALYDNITMFSGSPAKESLEYKRLLEDLNLTALAERVGDAPMGDFGDNISGGERQRINIARTLCKHPSILIFDEPTTGLDPENVKLINEFIFDRAGITRIVVTHNWAEDYLGRFDSVVKLAQ